MEFIVTTSTRAEFDTISRALEISQNLSIPYFTRNKESIEKIQSLNPDKGIFLVEKERNILLFNNYKYFFHPSMAKLRIKSIRDGNYDHMIQAMELKAGDSLLDCTLGLASDAIVASFIIGDEGKILGLEAVDILAWIVEKGLKKNQEADIDIQKAMSRIKVINIDHHDFLAQTEPNSFDVIYFDPMFQRSVIKSSAIQAIKPFSCNKEIDINTINRAKEVAKGRIVIKERSGSKLFSHLGCNRIVGGKYSKVAYGIIDLD